MILSKKHREEFVRRVMEDVPQIDYKTQADDFARKELAALRKAAGLADFDNERLDFRRVSIDTWENKETGVWSINESDGWSSEYRTPTFVNQGQYGVAYSEIKALEKHPELLALHTKYVDQQNERVALSKRIRAVIDSCNTLKQATDALPEFAKYLPDESPKADRSLPVVGNLVAELTTKGWPKGQKPVVKKTTKKAA